MGPHTPPHSRAFSGLRADSGCSFVPLIYIATTFFFFLLILPSLCPAMRAPRASLVSSSVTTHFYLEPLSLPETSNFPPVEVARSPPRFSFSCFILGAVLYDQRSGCPFQIQYHYPAPQSSRPPLSPFPPLQPTEKSFTFPPLCPTLPVSCFLNFPLIPFSNVTHGLPPLSHMVICSVGPLSGLNIECASLCWRVRLSCVGPIQVLPPSRGSPAFKTSLFDSQCEQDYHKLR